MNELIIIAGGLGTRLRSKVPHLPKSMAPVNGKPFIDYVMDYFISQGIDKFIFALGYKSELLYQYLIEKYERYNLSFSFEKEPLGTGGAIAQAVKKASEKKVFITNGDTLFKIDLKALTNVHIQNNAECTVALKPLEDFDRFGAVQTDVAGRITSFEEKKHHAKGLINGGVYYLNVKKFLKRVLETKFSFEKDYLEKFVRDGYFFASIQNAYFIDMGVPEDYHRAEKELK